MELLQGCRNRKEIRNLKSFIMENFQTVLHPSESISQKAMGILEQFSISHGLKVIDSVIAATAIENGYSLSTANLKHYRVIPGLDLVPFKP
jgi:predicted nucleic acid-binding protein